VSCCLRRSASGYMVLNPDPSPSDKTAPFCSIIIKIEQDHICFLSEWQYSGSDEMVHTIDI